MGGKVLSLRLKLMFYFLFRSTCIIHISNDAYTYWLVLLFKNTFLYSNFLIFLPLQMCSYNLITPPIFLNYFPK